jgi:AcrR family transcriptional regulator
VPCSEPTFFNHFKSKEHLLVFFIQLWSVEMAWQAARLGTPEDPLEAIAQIFTQTARYTVANPGIMTEILAFQARSRIKEPPPLTQAEILLAHPDKSGIESFSASDGGLDALLPPLLGQAVGQGLLPAHTDIPAAFFALGSIFFGTVVLGRQSDLAYLEPMYQHQLRLLWAGLRAQP